MAMVGSYLPFVQSKVTPSYPAVDVVNNYVTNSMLTDRFGLTLDSLADVMSFVYTNWSEIETNNTHLLKVLDMATDYQFFIPAYVSARALLELQAPERNTYKYLFTHRSSFGRFIPWVPGAGHGDELPYVFGFPSSMQTGLRFPDTLPPEELALSETIMTYWTNFAKTGYVTFLKKIYLKLMHFNLQCVVIFSYFVGTRTRLPLFHWFGLHSIIARSIT